MTGWWLRLSVALRVSLVVTLGVLAMLLLASVLGRMLLGALIVDGADATLGNRVSAAAGLVRQGRPAPQARVLDVAGGPVDGGARPPLRRDDVRALRSGEPVLQRPDSTDGARSPAEESASAAPRRWRGRVVTAPDGAQRLVVAGTELTGYGYTTRLAQDWMLGAAVLGALAAGVLTWGAIRLSLRPVDRMRAAARELPSGQRLPVPAARDELRGLAESLNALLRRRDEATARLQRFTGDAAHELRSPVASIRAQAEVAVLHPDPEGSQEVLADVVTESERLSMLVGDMLLLARADAGQIGAAEPVDLAFAVHAAVERLGDGVPVRFEAPAGHAMVLAAPAEVKVVLDNLLRNARRYARARITVAVLPSGSSVRLVVDDDGPGIPAGHRARVFDRFYRVSRDRARDSGGSGLGLALVAELVRRRRGSVAVADSPDGGARFDIRWPAAPRTEP